MRRSIYKRKVQRGPRKGQKAAKWTIEYQRADGRMQTETAYTDKQASLQLLAQREREVAQGITGLEDPYQSNKSRPIEEHISDYNREQAGKGVDSKTQQRSRNRLLKAFAAMSTRTAADLSIDKAQDYVAGLVADEGLSLATRNHHASTLHDFGRFLADRDRLPKNPFAKLVQVRVTDSDRTHEPRVFTVEELTALREAAPSNRALVYLFTAYTGFRHGEDKAVTWRDASIDTDSPTITLRDTKNGDTVSVNIPPWLASELRKHRAEETLKLGGKLPPDRKLLHIPVKMVRHLRRDAARAKLGDVRLKYATSSGGHRYLSAVEWIDPASAKVRLDFHDLRAFYATLLFEQGVPLHEVKRLCRHASITTTEKHYTTWRESRLRGHVDAIPNPLSGSVPASVAPRPVEGWGGHSGPPDNQAQRRANQ